MTDDILETRVVSAEWRPIIRGQLTGLGHLVHFLEGGGYRVEIPSLGRSRDYSAQDDFRLTKPEDDGEGDFPPLGGSRYDREAYRRAFAALTETRGYRNPDGVSHIGLGPSGERISLSRWRNFDGSMNYVVTRTE